MEVLEERKMFSVQEKKVLLGFTLSSSKFNRLTDLTHLTGSLFQVQRKVLFCPIHGVAVAQLFTRVLSPVGLPAT